MKKAVKTKQAIMEAAKTLLQQKGSVTVKEIAEMAHVNVAAINYHFTDKENLINLVINSLLEELKNMVEQYLGYDNTQTETAKKYLNSFIHRFYDFAIENIGILNYMLFPQNKNALESATENFEAIFSMDSDLSDKVIKRLALMRKESDPVKLKVKYGLLLTGFLLPLLTQINKRPLFKSAPDLLTDNQLKDAYIDEMINLILN